MKELEIIEENGKTRIKTNTEELTKEDALRMSLSAYLGICEEYDINPVELLVGGMQLAKEGE